MITELRVKNLALIEEAEVTFASGLNILTGETGAGKSILLGSINMALGQKMSRDMQRREDRPTLVELVFQVESGKVREKLKSLEVETEDGQLIITRKFQDGRSVSRLNGETCTAARIREISALLLDIHGQHEHQSLLYPNRQLEILDAFGQDRIRPVLDEVSEAFGHYQDIRKELGRFEMNEEERAREISFLEYELREIGEADLREGEEEELEKSYRRMSNSRKILERLAAVCQCSGDEGAAGLVSRALGELQSVADLDEDLGQMSSSLADIDSLLSDFNREVSSYLDGFSFEEEEFYRAEVRLDQLNHLRSKYGRTLADILAYRDRQQARLEELEHFAEQREKLVRALARSEEELDGLCGRLSEIRRECARELSDRIRQGLRELNFLTVEFDIIFSRTDRYSQKGYDAVEFHISTNPGEPVRPLSRVVSGGELSRIMLAIKTLLADRDDTETLIFDEIDTGISGRTAQKVSEKMARIASGRQVICITHLAQIAAMADTHFVISKGVDHGETATRILRLTEEESSEELARILGGAELTQAVYDNAREMKRLARERKAQLSLAGR